MENIININSDINYQIPKEEINYFMTLDGKIQLIKKFRKEIKFLRNNGRESKTKTEKINTRLKINQRLRQEIKHFKQFIN